MSIQKTTNPLKKFMVLMGVASASAIFGYPALAQTVPANIPQNSTGTNATQQFRRNNSIQNPTGTGTNQQFLGNPATPIYPIERGTTQQFLGNPITPVPPTTESGTSQQFLGNPFTPNSPTRTRTTQPFSINRGTGTIQPNNSNVGF